MEGPVIERNNNEKKNIYKSSDLIIQALATSASPVATLHIATITIATTVYITP